MRSLPLRRLIHGPLPNDSRIFYHNIWFRDHNNSRYAELLPRLERVDPYLITCSRRRVIRAVQTRLLRLTREIRGDIVFRLAGQRYESMLYTGDADQSVNRFSGKVVVDIDDPKFSLDEVRMLNSRNVRAYVVTADWAGRRYREFGVTKPFVVIPQGVSLRSLSMADIEGVAANFRRRDDFVVGYVASGLRCAGDRGGDNSMYNVDHLLDLWREIHARVPRAVLWLIGQPSRRVLRRCEGRDDIRVLGRIPKHAVLAYVSNFDVALYPRREDQGVQAAKVAEYLGAGVPTVSYDYRVTEILGRCRAGLLVRTGAEFVEAVESLSRHEAQRQALGAGARLAGKELDWDRLASRYRRDVLDVYL